MHQLEVSRLGPGVEGYCPASRQKKWARLGLKIYSMHQYTYVVDTLTVLHSLVFIFCLHVLLSRLRVIANSKTVPEYLDNLHQLQSSDEWLQDIPLQNWLERKWLPQHKVLTSVCCYSCRAVCVHRV